MAKSTITLGILALILAVLDLIHGPHNGDMHRTLIHIPEFVCFFALLCLLEIWAFKISIREFDINRWIVVIFLSLLTFVLSLIFFGLSGGSFHGDGGPIAVSFLVLWGIAELVLPVSLVVFVVIAIKRKRQGIPILGGAHK